VRRAAWRITSPGLTALQVMQPLRQQLQDAGLEVLLDCPSQSCGGFDFRFATETLPGPNMYVNIRQFHFVTAVRRDAARVVEVVTVLTSTSATSAHVQIIHAGALNGGGFAVQATADLPVTQQALEADTLEGQLLRLGHAVLVDLDFATGNSELGDGPFTSLTQLAAFLAAQPDLRIALVGHTDSVGGLDSNIAISKRRAQSVRDRLIVAHGVDAVRMDAEGMGYLAPVASNLGPAGREQNRRVEAIVLSGN
jgi:outer membrane protein OmpA-like peptidoglycan-associated protein